MLHNQGEFRENLLIKLIKNTHMLECYSTISPKFDFFGETLMNARGVLVVPVEVIGNHCTKGSFINNVPQKWGV